MFCSFVGVFVHVFGIASQIASPVSRKSRAAVLEKCNMCAVHVCLSMFSNGFVVTVCVCVCACAPCACV